MRFRKVVRSACSVLVLAAATGVGPLAAPAPARAASASADVRSLQWHLDALKIPQAHRLSKGKGVVVAVVDSGVQASHPDLAGQVLPGKGFGPGSTDDGQTDPDKTAGHGTAMAGIIAARGGSAEHALGIAPEAKILPVSLGPSGLREAPAGIRWAVDEGADVINVSLGTERDDPSVVEAVAYALSHDVVVVAASGNTGSTYLEMPMPAKIPGVIAVGGATRSGALWDGTIVGPPMAISAPGEAIVAPTRPGVAKDDYAVYEGTSASAAIVSGVVALVRARYPDLDAANVVNRVVSTARDRGPKGRDPEYGFGSVDVLAALTGEVPTVEANPLGAPPAPASTSAAPADAAGDEGSSGNWALIAIVLALVLVAAIVVVVVLVTRRARR
ncbi:type VII secretion-associated serine protease mycosin [Asanoa hainanensis]|uniref:Type VII secretion-associated serine protease mycosin n=1 Tax=Asanoa hainanensis TaxID=560556 RepID=A0A239FS04_9ACTN|nr:S8 family serine peptidase [Asanoa hainanensis]SNS59012.1 type VII secretion-associated serine protease mycosin [Asanoa hainanensis]